jgi:hypothetical protein
MSLLLRTLLAGVLGVAVALLVSCGGSSGKLIPVANAGPLQSDFEAIAQEAETGNGNCTATEAAIAKAEQDFAALPSTIDSGLHNTLRQGIQNLRSRALALCAQPLTPTTTTSAAPKTTTSTATTTPTVTTTTTSTSTTPTTAPTTPTTTPTPGGGTQAPGAGEAPPAGSGQGGGTGVGEGTGGAAGGAGAGGGQEGGK